MDLPWHYANQVLGNGHATSSGRNDPAPAVARGAVPLAVHHVCGSWESGICGTTDAAGGREDGKVNWPESGWWRDG